MKPKLALYLYFNSVFAFSQVGIGTTDVDPSAILEIVSNDLGVLLPKVNLSSSTDTSTINNPQDGLVVYNTNATGIGTTAIMANCMYVFNGTTNTWERLNKEHEYGDFKYSICSTDHNGWYVLDGRAISSFSAQVQTIATALGFATHLPDLTNRVVKQTGSGVGATGGSNTTSFSISQSHLPDVDFIGNTDVLGNHNHNIDNMATDNLNVVTSIVGGTLTSLQYYTNDSGTLSTEIDGSHSHTVTVNSGGSGAPVSNVNVENPYFSANAFIYLGY